MKLHIGRARRSITPSPPARGRGLKRVDAVPHYRWPGRPPHGAPPEMARPRALISVLGFSWQPVAFMAAWCKPEVILILGTEESLKLEPGGERILSLVARVSGISRDVIQHECVGDPGETDIYPAVRDFLRDSVFSPHEIFVDPTGGKKSMSASAALAGFLVGAPLVYVDYTEYHGSRIPVPGTEYPRLLANPLEVMGDLEMRDVFGAFNRSDFQEAERLAVRLGERLYEPREAQCLAKLAEGYGAWDRFDFESAKGALRETQDVMERHSDQGRWSWVPRVRDVLSRNFETIELLAGIEEKPECFEDGIPLLAWYLSRARRLLEVRKTSLTVLLSYAAVERYVNLCLWVCFGLDNENPDYSLVEGKLDRDRYCQAGKRLFEKSFKARDLAGPLMFINGVQLLVALAPDRLRIDDLGSLKGLSSVRNKCEYEHGFLPQTPSYEDAERFLNKAEEILLHGCGGKEVLDPFLEGCGFPKLEAQ